MKAILITAAGNADVLQLQEVDKPALPSPHHLRVKLAAAGVNPLDTKLRTKPAYFPDTFPAILGCDGAGVVEAIGNAVTRFKIGDSVYFNNGGLGGNLGDESGCYAEYTLSPILNLVTALPIASTTPAPSQPRIAGKLSGK